MNNNYKLQSINAKLKRIGKILFCTFIIYNLAFSIVFSANLALNKPVFASSAFSGSAEDAIDGDGGTRWESVHSDPQWIKVDLGDVYTVNKVTITWETAYADAYQIRVSTNNIDWTVVYSTDSESDANGLVDVITFSDTDAQYVVMYGTHRATGYGYSIYEFYVSSGYGNIALNKTATASSVQSVVAAVDGNLGLGWESKHEVDPQWIYVDLQSTYTINEVVLIWEAAYGKSYQIQGSSDANIWWENLYSTTSENGGVDTIIFSSTDTRYLRMYGTERGTGWGYNLFEFEVYYDIVSPAGISDLTALYGSDDGEVVLNWTAPGDDGTVNNLTGTFRIKYSTVAIIKSDDFDDPPSNYAVTTVDISTASLTPLTACTTTLYTLEAGASYWFAIKTQDKNDYWSVWNSSHDDTNVNTELYSAAQDLAPPAPTGVTALAGNTQIKLTWMPVTGEPDLYQYEVWCDSTDVYDFSDTFLVGTTLQAYTTFYHTGLTNGCSYLYRIITVDKGTDDGFVGTTLKSGYSDTTVSTMPYLSVPLPPTGFSGVAQSSTKIKWSWTDNASTEDGFEIRSDTDGVVIDSATLATEIPGIGGGSGGTTFWLQIGLTANTSSHVQYIHSINNYGLSEPTTDATAPVWTLANKANDCDFTDVYITTITLDWTENSNPTYTHWGVSISTDDFVTNTSTPIAYSDNLTETTTTFYSLSANCTYSFRIYSYNEDEINDWYYEAGSTSTFIEKATGVEFTVYATSISARPAGTFTDITKDNSGIITYNITASTGSGWVQNTNWWDGPDSLTPNTTYIFEANSRNLYNIESGSTTQTSTSTLCNVPGDSTLAEICISSIAITIDTNSNPYWSEYSIKVTSGTDEAGQVQYLDTDNTLTGSAVYQSTVSWGTNIWVTGLVANTTHGISVNAKNSNSVTTSYTATVTSCTHIEKATGVEFTVYATSISARPAGTFTDITKNNSGIITYNITASTGSGWVQNTNWWDGPDSLTPNTTYIFEANSRNLYNIESGSTTQTSTSTLCNVPGEPTLVEVYGSSITLQIDTNSNSYWTEYSIKMASGVNSTDQYLQTGSTFAAGPVVYQSTVTWGTEIWLKDLVANTSHTICVNARNSNGINTEYSITITTDTLLNPTSGLYVVSRTTYSVGLKWFRNNNPSDILYAVSFSSDNFAAHVSTIVALSDSFTATTTAAYSLTANTTYWFRTWTSTAVGGQVSSYDGPVSTMTNSLAPNAPINLSVDSSQTTTTQIKWNFTDNAVDEEALYVSSGTNTGMRVSGSLGQLPGTGTTTSYIETSLSPNTQYTRYAEAYNISNSSWSVPISTYTHADIPVSFAVDTTSKEYIKLTWSPATVGGNTRYAISRTTDTGGTWSFIVTWSDNLTATTTTNYGLSAGTTYHYRLYGYNGMGAITTNYSGPLSTMTVPQNDPPVISTATAITCIYFEGNKAVIRAVVTDDNKITEVTLYYRKKGETDWEEASFSPLPSTTSYSGSAVIPGSYVTKAGVEYYIRAYDDTLYGYWKSAASPQEITVKKIYGKGITSGNVNVPDENPDDGETGIYIPAGALDSGIQMLIEQKEAEDELPTTETFINTRKNSAKPVAVFEFGPDGTRFKVPVTLTIVYFDDVVTAAGIDESRLQMYWYNSGKWRLLGGTVNTVNNTVSAKTVRFSKYALFASKKVSITAGEKTFLTPYIPVQFSDITELTVYDIKGHTVIELEALSGTNIVTWDGTDENADTVESGAYIYKATTVAGDEKYGVIVVSK